MKKLLVTAMLLAASPAIAQWQTPNHSVPVGQGGGVTGFNSVGPAAADLPLVGNGTSADPSFRVLSNAGLATMPANTVKCNPTGGSATPSDCAYGQVNTFTVDHTIANTDCGGAVKMGSGSTWPLTLTLSAPLAAGCRIDVVGQLSRAVKLSGFTGLGLTSSSMLWPTKSFSLLSTGSSWLLTIADGRWKIPNNTTLYVDVNNGNDANDCLAAGSGNACKTMTQALRVNDKDYFDRSGTSIYPVSTLTVQLADNASGGNCTSLCYALVDIAYAPVGTEGRNGTLIKGNAASPSNVVIADAVAYGINVFRNSVEIADLQFGQTSCAATPKANAGLAVIEGGAVFFQGTVQFGCVNAQQMVVTNGGQVQSNQRPINVVAGGTNFLYEDSGGQIGLSNSTVTFSNSPAYSGQTVTAFAGTTMQLGGVTWTNGGTVTGAKYFCRGATTIETDTGSGASIPGSVAGTTGTGCVVF